MNTEATRWTIHDKNNLRWMASKHFTLNEMMVSLGRTDPSVRKQLKKLGYEPKTIWVKGN